jgi:hypothetical protein
MHSKADQHPLSQHEKTLRDLALLDQGAHAPQEIKEERDRTVKELQRQLADVGSFLNVEKVMALVFEFDASMARTFLSAMLTAFDCDASTVDTSVLYVIQDVWNYLPHRFLQGRCPAELMAYLFEDELLRAGPATGAAGDEDKPLRDSRLS